MLQLKTSANKESYFFSIKQYFAPVTNLLILLITLNLFFACNTNSTTNNTQTESSQSNNLKTELTDTANVALSADTATQFSEPDEGEDEDVHDYDYAGIYLGSDPKYKMVFEGNTFQYFIGKNMKLNGEMAINVYKEGESDHLILLPAGNKERIDLAVTWDAFYKAEGFDYDEMHFTRQPK